MTDTEKIVTKTKEYILNLYSEGYSTHQNMVNGLKNGIDYFVGRKIGFETIKDEILTTCLTEFNERTKVFDKVGHLKMVDRIKNDFIKFVTELNVNKLSEVKPISFERRLKVEESKTIENRLKVNFDFGSWKDENFYWEPLCKTQNIINSIHFEDNVFKNQEVQKIVEILKSISGDRIFLLTEENINYEVETSSFDIDWIESAYCDFKTSWLIYVSHEGTITFAGEELVTGIENELTELIKQKNPWN
ncbi:hypothetical protein [Flavobacterium glaciei]|uniref:Uncharacterized protein n=1 Tax=Flavobacterium glaciei TaxID=386300 RepID=A0A562PHX7_9FLAO|nr:hypothetical protein [Flavobacterium glaciei]RDI49458.1 hypothetical protein DFR66_1287 [Flavobacterium glaciei]TWI43606.1 hypothetical protein IQ02_02877 [Flavobacterium glaciei]